MGSSTNDDIKIKIPKSYIFFFNNLKTSLMDDPIRNSQKTRPKFITQHKKFSSKLKEKQKFMQIALIMFEKKFPFLCKK